MAADTSEIRRRLQRLQCSVQNYEWGKIGWESQVARLYSRNCGATIDTKKPYAEFWVGTHDSGPSFLYPCIQSEISVGSEFLTLKSWILRNPDVLGDIVRKKWGNDVPFLLKVLSVAKPLSIQAHPDKELAEVLHKFLPNTYKDENHKPEMALALTQFEALCGFINLEELICVIRNYPEIVRLVGTADTDRVLLLTERDGKKKAETVLRSVFTKLMTATKDAVSGEVLKLKIRLNMEMKVRDLTDREHLVLRLEKQYPHDVGILASLFLNYVKLRSGEALYLGANEPHAYISGDCIECMATSDNVVRAGLTPKYRDIPTLCSMLTYKQGFPEVLHGVRVDDYTRKYVPPFDEFEVDRSVLPQGGLTKFPASRGPSIFLVTGGRGRMITSSSEHVVVEGDAVFAPSEVEIHIVAESKLQLYRAGVNSRFFSNFTSEKI